MSAVTYSLLSIFGSLACMNWLGAFYRQLTGSKLFSRIAKWSTYGTLTFLSIMLVYLLAKQAMFF